MALVPKARDAMMTFFRLCIGRWLNDPSSIGLDAQQAADVAAAYEALVEAENEASRLQRLTKGAVQIAARRDAELRRIGGAAINTIRAYAAAQRDPGVYVRAAIPPPRRRTALPPPPVPTGVIAQPRNNGVVAVSWQGSVANGTTYTVWRHTFGPNGTNRTGPAEYIGTVGATTILDYTVPPMVLSAEYTVQAIRGRKRSYVSDSATVYFTRGTIPTGARAAA